MSLQNVYLGGRNLELGTVVSKSANLELGGDLLKDVLGVVVHELRGGVLARVLQENLLATGVFVKELGNIVDVALDGHPGRFLCC